MPGSRPARRLILLGALLLLGLCAPSAAAESLLELQEELGAQTSLAGPADGAYVYDLGEQRVLFSERAGVARAPASIEKLYTATAALARFGPRARLSTTVLGVGQLAPGGVWQGSLYLHGGGDPTFGDRSFILGHYDGIGASLTALVRQIVRVDGIHHITGTVEGDESYFDSLRGEPSSGYAFDPFLEGTLSALAYNRGQSGSERGRHAPAAFAAHRLWAALKADGVSIRGRSGAAAAPPGAAVLARAASPTIAQLLGLALPPSDNFFAETLAKDLGASFAGAGTTAAGAAVVRATIASLLGLQPHLVDGSGLSESDRTSPLEVVQMLTQLHTMPIGAVLRDDLAVAGHNGTLALRMRNTAAAGHCEGKTGTLTKVSNLAGYCQTVTGHEIAFAFFNDGLEPEAARRFQDHMTASIAGY